ncbi:MAG: dephospho-CoA kinase [Lentisphaeraceae bacterium]|nr:dephospho-CoA kinase [Lentisphaeraceae bacterium]
MLTALTGGIGSGKSTALNIFNELGAETQDTDLIVHKIYEDDKEVHDSLLKRWGKEVFLDGLPNRKAIAQLVFNNKENLEWLNQLIHPKVKKRIKSGNSTNISIIAVPLLYEIGWETEFDSVISIWCDKSTQLKRLLGRGWTKEECDARLAAQLSQDEKLAKADLGIINNWSEKFLHRQCREILEKLRNKEK